MGRVQGLVESMEMSGCPTHEFERKRPNVTDRMSQQSYRPNVKWPNVYNLNGRCRLTKKYLQNISTWLN